MRRAPSIAGGALVKIVVKVDLRHKRPPRPASAGRRGSDCAQNFLHLQKLPENWIGSQMLPPTLFQNCDRLRGEHSVLLGVRCSPLGAVRWMRTIVPGTSTEAAWRRVGALITVSDGCAIAGLTNSKRRSLVSFRATIKHLPVGDRLAPPNRASRSRLPTSRVPICCEREQATSIAASGGEVAIVVSWRDANPRGWRW
jgi:hypothetical protein